VPDGRKLEEIQEFRHFAYAALSASVPLPLGQAATQLVVSEIMLELGDGSPTHEAWQLTSPLAHASKHLVSADVVVGAGADVVPEAAWATAARPTTERRAAENFIVMN